MPLSMVPGELLNSPHSLQRLGIGIPAQIVPRTKGTPMSVRDEIVSFMRQQPPGLYVNYKDIAKEIDHDAGSTGAALSKIKSDFPQFGIRKGTSAGYYYYDPTGDGVMKDNAESVDGFGYGAPEVYEAAGNIAGHEVVRDAKGRLRILMNDEDVQWTFNPQST